MQSCTSYFAFAPGIPDSTWQKCLHLLQESSIKASRLYGLPTWKVSFPQSIAQLEISSSSHMSLLMISPRLCVSAAGSGFAATIVCPGFLSLRSHPSSRRTPHQALRAVSRPACPEQYWGGGGLELNRYRDITYRAQGHPGGDGGEGDLTGGPDPERAGIDDWPTLVIEAGDSESLGELHNDMRWWFRTSNHQVKIALLAKFDHSDRAIVLEKWEEEPRGSRPGATTTRHAPALQPTCRQNITISRNTTADPVSYNVTRGALVLGFRLLFLRDPGPGEGDFIIACRICRTTPTKSGGTCGIRVSDNPIVGLAFSARSNSMPS
ncbi:hypothetical protein B0H67DRAFT_89794 [Lasiosphaeris hirsuta]|uniref:Uncharacterized protein n=1 Tax=Lasiosphaeris hirsuta TaxID=260670 RepID=A0AA40BDF0_9PEZI|nr:hypothetical protein B0H67DRAFT_89794 [Lasiosphaeris hirsuta]